MKPRKTWQEKLADNKGLPKVGAIEGKMTRRWGTGRMVVPAPLEVKELMDQVPKGKLATVNELRHALALKHKTDIACPITTGIFAWIAANAAAEAAASGAKRTTPYWRTLKAGGELNPKYHGGIEAVRQKLQAEGHHVVQRGKKYFVESFDRRLCSF
jgi:hypothetical protein